MEIYLRNGRKLNFLPFFLLFIYFFIKNRIFYKYADIYYKKENMKNIILFILTLLCIAQFFLIKEQQNKIKDLQRTLWIKEQVILNDRR